MSDTVKKVIAVAAIVISLAGLAVGGYFLIAAFGGRVKAAVDGVRVYSLDDVKKAYEDGQKSKAGEVTYWQGRYNQMVTERDAALAEVDRLKNEILQMQIKHNAELNVLWDYITDLEGYIKHLEGKLDENGIAYEKRDFTTIRKSALNLLRTNSIELRSITQGKLLEYTSTNAEANALAAYNAKVSEIAVKVEQRTVLDNYVNNVAVLNNLVTAYVAAGHKFFLSQYFEPIAAQLLPHPFRMEFTSESPYTPDSYVDRPIPTLYTFWLNVDSNGAVTYGDTHYTEPSTHYPPAPLPPVYTTFFELYFDALIVDKAYDFSAIPEKALYHNEIQLSLTKQMQSLALTAVIDALEAQKATLYEAYNKIVTLSAKYITVIEIESAKLDYINAELEKLDNGGTDNGTADGGI